MSGKKTRKELEVIKISADEASELAEAVINTVREPLIALSENLRIIKVSRSFYEFFKVKPEETMGQLIYDLGNKQWDIPRLRELLETIIPQKASFENYEVEHYFATIGRRTMLLNARQIERVLGKERIILLAIEDITERKQAEEELRKHREYLEELVEQRTVELKKQLIERKRMERHIKASLKEKEVLLKEVHHRVNNNMQVIVSMLNLQSRYVDDEQAIEAFRKSQNRIRTMALVHEKLYQTTDLARINFAEYTRDLTNYLLSAYGKAAGAITLKMDIEDISLSIDTVVPCGMILNEFITNSIKHAFPGGRGGEIFIELHSDNDNLILTARDNGAGIPEDLDLRNTESMGLPLIDAFVEQLEGSVELNRKDGTEFRITFPMRKYDKRG